MRLTDIRIKLCESHSPTNRLRAFCALTFDNTFVIRDVKLIEGHDGLFVAMPSRKLSDHCPTCNEKNHLRAWFCNSCGRSLDGNRHLKAEVNPRRVDHRQPPRSSHGREGHDAGQDAGLRTGEAEQGNISGRQQNGSIESIKQDVRSGEFRKGESRDGELGHGDHRHGENRGRNDSRMQNAPGSSLGQGRRKLHADIAHPINADCRQAIEREVMSAFYHEVERSKLPGYVAPSLDGEDSDFEEDGSVDGPGQHRGNDVSRALGYETRGRWAAHYLGWRC